MPSRTSAPKKVNLDAPAESAIFQHSPFPGFHLRTEWEPGCQPDEVYDSVLPRWRAWLRRYLVRRLRQEKVWMAEWQGRMRTEVRDRYFYYSAVFGTHTFFMTFLPLIFFFGHPLKGRGLLYVVGLGIYSSSFAKDLVCTPRPYSPPMVRLTMSTHHHEYGFPSSHSTNSVSMALFLGEWLLETRAVVGMPGVLLGWTVLTIYAASVVGGRLYSGMHSIADIVGGSLMGVGCWAMWSIIRNASEAWVDSGHNSVPTITILLTLALVHFHPEPVDDCPCFEDAIAILSVVLGSYVGHWLSTQPDANLPPAPSLTTYGGVLGLTIALIRVTTGIGVLFAWRLFAKAVLLTVLPPIFRAVSRVFDVDLPTRKHYTAATAYHEVPPIPLRTIPSVIDLQTIDISTDVTPDTESPSVSQLIAQQSQTPSSSTLIPPAMNGHKVMGWKPSTNPKATADEDSYLVSKARKRRRDPVERAKYDAEVLTKVAVYSGIGLLATTLLPALFGRVESFS